MASRPNLVPEDQPWLVLDIDYTEQFQSPNKRECFEWIMERRIDGETGIFYVYGPDSKHEHAVVNQVAWERANG